MEIATDIGKNSLVSPAAGRKTAFLSISTKRQFENAFSAREKRAPKNLQSPPQRLPEKWQSAPSPPPQRGFLPPQAKFEVGPLPTAKMKNTCLHCVPFIDAMTGTTPPTSSLFDCKILRLTANHFPLLVLLCLAPLPSHFLH